MHSNWSIQRVIKRLTLRHTFFFVGFGPDPKISCFRRISHSHSTVDYHILVCAASYDHTFKVWKLANNCWQNVKGTFQNRWTRFVGKGRLWVTSFIYKYKTSTTYPLYEATQCFVLINKWCLWVQSALPTIRLYPQSGYDLQNNR